MSLESRLRAWVNEQGYPLEMRVAIAFQSAGFFVIQSEYYEDPDIGTFREIDVYASHSLNENDPPVRISFAIECKRTPSKPWILFTTELGGLADPARVAQRAASRDGHLLLHELAYAAETQRNRLFSVEARAAYGVTQGFTDRNDVAYSAAMGVAKAALAFTRRADKWAGAMRTRFIEIVFPVVVVDAPLFQCYLGPDSELILESVTRGTLLWRNPIVTMPHTIIDVVRLDEISTAAQEAMEHVEAFLRSSATIAALKSLPPPPPDFV